MPFVDALKAFQEQSPMEVWYYYVARPNAQGQMVGDDGIPIDAIKTKAVHGLLDPEEALVRMLKGTGFVYDLVMLDDGPTLRVRKRGAEGGSAEVEGASRQSAESPRSGETAHTMDQVVVTGTLIRGLDAITAPMIVLGEREKKQVAFGTVQDLILTLPQNFGGGPSEDFSTGSVNFTRGSSINLRGLGTGATLVLVNGRRQPASGIDGDFVDVSTIPWSAVDRVEVLADGGSALYGSDAVAGVVNIIMRDELPGAGEVQARLGSAPGGANEKLLAQFLGHRWADGKFLLSYQFSERTALGASERRYAADADKRPLGGSDLRTFFSIPGNILDPITRLPAFAIPAGQDGQSLTSGDLAAGVVNLQNQVALRDLLPNRTTHSVFFSASQKFADRFELFSEGRYGHRDMTATEQGQLRMLAVPANNAFFVDPFGGSPFVMVAYNFLDDLGPIHHQGTTETYTGTVGMTADLTNRWQATVSGYVGREGMDWKGYGQVDPTALAERLADPNPATAFNPFGSGGTNTSAILDAVRYVQRERAISRINAVSLVIDGPLPGLPLGTPKLALGFDRRQEGLYRYETVGRDAFVTGDYKRTVEAAFGELSVPLLRRVTVSLAGRYERLSDSGHTFNPKIGLRWAASDSFRFRGSWGSSFRAPTLVDLYDQSQDVVVMFPLADPNSATGHSLTIVQGGSNRRLSEETARTWTAGIDFAPAIAPGLTWTSTYYSIDYHDRIFHYSPAIALESLLVDEQWSSLVIRNPSLVQIEEGCRSPALVGSVDACLSSSPAAIIDVRARNLSTTKVKGVDIELSQNLRTNFGSLRIGLSGNYVLNFEQAVTRAAPSVDLAGSVFNPPILRLRGTAAWYQHGSNQPGFAANAAVDYFGKFRDHEHAPVTRIGALATLDFQLSYRTDEADDWLGNMELTLNAVNIFNQDPPFMNHELGYDPTNSKPYGRVISLGLQKNW